MQQIDLRMIAGSPNPIRKTWDEEQMNQLAESIRAQGVIVPIKVRPMPGIELGDCRYHGINWLSEVQLDDTANGICWRCDELRDGHGLGGDDDEEPVYPLQILEIVYGHRRVEAARRAGLESIPAIVDDTDDTQTLIQALIENVQREDMSPVEKAQALNTLLEALKRQNSHANLTDVAKIVGKPHQHISALLSLLDETKETQSMIGTHVGGAKVTHNKSRNGDATLVMSDTSLMPITETHVRMARAAGIETPEERHVILKKAATEELTYRDTRAVADAYVAADTPELKQAVLDTTGKLGDADRILSVARQKVGVEAAHDFAEERRRKAFEEYDRAVKDFLDWAKLSAKMLKAAQDAVRFKRFSPEGAQYAAREIDKLIDQLNEVKAQLKEVY